jgi:UDP-N-acetylmuramate dehydrogenase
VSGPFGTRTTLRVGGEARRVVEVESLDDLVALSEHLERDTPVYVLGRGSNTLVADAGFDGVVVHLGPAFASIEIDATTSQVVAGAAADLPVVARKCVDAGLEGFEWAVGVPGSLGGAVRMNAGGHGSSMSESVVAVRVVDLGTGSLEVLDARALTFGYRTSSIRSSQVVIDATLQLRPGNETASKAMLKEIVAWRRANQPGGANCGSVFTNPEGDSAGRLIEAAGCKGHRIGTAQVSEKHANFIQADDAGSADDVAALIEWVRAQVVERFGVRLETEVRMVGFSSNEGR